MNKMCYKNVCVAINYISDVEANFNNYDDKINKQLHHAIYNFFRTHNSDPVELMKPCMLELS